MGRLASVVIAAGFAATWWIGAMAWCSYAADRRRNMAAQRAADDMDRAIIESLRRMFSRHGKLCVDLTADEEVLADHACEIESLHSRLDRLESGTVQPPPKPLPRQRWERN